MRIPRKIKKKIPVGHYCYTPIKYDNETHIYHIEPCKYYKRIKIKDKPTIEDWENEFLDEIVGWCSLCRCEIDDQVKSCGEKY